MQQAKQLQSGLEVAKNKLAQEKLTITSAGGKITITTTASGDITDIILDPAIVDPQDTEFLQELIVKAIQEAQDKAKEKTAQEMGKLTGGLGLPPGLI